MIKLPEGFKARWLAALRGGQYMQGNGFLRSGDAYCCLGVAADVCGARWSKANPEDGPWNTQNSGRYMPAAEDLEPGVYEALSQDFESGDVQGYLARKNDNGWTFGDIANWIEREL